MRHANELLLLPQSSLAFRQSRGIRFPRTTKIASVSGPNSAARMANRRFTLRINRLFLLSSSRNRPIRTEASYNSGIVAISQNSNTTPSLCAAADLTPWLCELNTQLDGALADLAHMMQSVQSGTYARDANGQSFGLVQANFVPNATHLATRALERAAVTCFRSAIASFISFLDRLIAFQDLANEKLVVDRDITNLDDLYAYLNSKVNRRIGIVVSDTTLSNPKKLARFPGLSEVSKRAVLSYFALRRCIEHHQFVPQDDIQVSVWSYKLFVDDVEILQLPAHCTEGQTVEYRVFGEARMFPKGSKVTLDPQDVHSIIVALRGSIAPEIFNLHAAQFQPIPVQSHP